MMVQFVVVVCVDVDDDRRSNSYSQGIIINYLSTRCNLSGSSSSSSRSMNSSMYVIAIYVVLIDKSYRNRKHHRPPHEGGRTG